jgi:dienelactone hydrolase
MVLFRHLDRFCRCFAAFLVAWLAGGAPAVGGQDDFPPDRGAPGDRMIQAYLSREAEKMDATLLDGLRSAQDWERIRPQYEREYFYMLGLTAMPEKTPLAATITGQLQGDGYTVEMLHYQSRPHLYVTGNLYHPENPPPHRRLPAVLYVCGHLHQGRAGNKTAYQSHGIWFARHGYVCLVLDSLELGEIGATHHGTYSEGRWWWQSRGYTPAGVECLNGMRGIDYLAGRPDVDPRRIAVTGISGGGAATFWIAAADPRVSVAVPVSGMADLTSYVSHRVINGHCDCMFLYNTFQWPWTRIAAMVAPRPLLFANSDQDHIFPMDANDRVINRLKRFYSLYGASDRVDSLVSRGGHAYRQDLRQGVFRFINTYLKDDPRIVADSERDLVTGDPPRQSFPIEPDRLRVFRTDADIPKDELNTRIDRQFVAVAQPSEPGMGGFERWKTSLQDELRRVTFRYFPSRIPAARLIEQVRTDDIRLETEPGIEVGLRRVAEFKPAEAVKRILLVLRNAESASTGITDWLRRVRNDGDEVYLLTPRGVDRTRWTRRNPPNYVERAHALLGRTVDTGRVWDVAAAARYVCDTRGGKAPVYVVGEGSDGVLAAYAALWEPRIAGAILNRPPLGHMEPDAPPLLNVLRVCDIPDVMGMLAPRPLVIYGDRAESLEKVAAIYRAAGAPQKFSVMK